MNNIRNSIKKEFTIVPNALINDNKLSDRARFVFVYMASKPDDWTFYNVELSRALNYTIETLRKYIGELNLSGWISKTPQLRIGGLFSANIYTLNSIPIKNQPYMVFPDTVKNRDGKLLTQKKTVSEKNRVGKKQTLTNKEEYKKGKKEKINPTKGVKILK